MNKLLNFKLKKISSAVSSIILASTLTAGLAGCVEEASLNNGDVVYAPEARPLGVLAPENGEYSPGSEVTLKGRLTGTVSGETLLWTQTGGTTIEIADPTQAEISFEAPIVDGLESFVFTLSVIGTDGEVVLDNNNEPLVDEVTAVVFDPALKVRLEAEDDTVAVLKGDVNIASEGDDHYLPGFSGTGATSDILPGASVTFTATLDKASYYTVYLGYAIPGDYGGKQGQVIVNGAPVDVELSATGQFSGLRVGTFSLNAGDNIIEVCCGWNYYRVDYVELLPAATPSEPLPVAPELVNDLATVEAKALMEFLSDNYVKATLTGQTEFPTKVDGAFPLIEYDKVVAQTGGDAPAIVAFDFMDYSASSTTDSTGLTESIIAEHQAKNIIVSVLHHWRAPSGNPGTTGSFYSDSDKPGEGSTFDLAAALADKNSAEYNELLVDIDLVAVELKKLADAGIPVLWRPLHEAQGEWFWWGAAGPDALKELWMLMYDRLTVDHALNNLIWVFTHTKDLSNDWYPGDNYVDIVGYDGYADPRNDDKATFKGQYTTLKDRHDGTKLVALTETGTIPDVAVMHEQDAWWSFFITWNSETWDSASLIGPDGAKDGVIATNYAAEGVLNLDDVPGGVPKTEAGIYESFESEGTGKWEFQNNWSPIEGIQLAQDWAADGDNSLSGIVQLEAGDDDVILQVYPEGGLVLGDVTTLKITANVKDAGAGVTAMLFAKDPDGGWNQGDTVAVVDGGVELSIDVSEIPVIGGFGVRFMGPDNTATPAQFYIDKVEFVNAEAE
ncbi:glycosyl hydrolase [Colwellia sp. E2M01]|uniref:glycosyl hydrolase n=1 Tax=Colwellia sp. E2M01 TaxID=2841561 RepID=UPI001C09F73F|nr:glycosyl hydrolase [Colwellia sp. E2M01]MBU2870433.1 hypothetical protein [Colwellia sp. E2M01]